MDLDNRQDRSEATQKRLRVDAPVFYSQGMREGAAALEPVANDALIMALATGDDVVYYGSYFEKNRLLRELTFEREARARFGVEHENNSRSSTIRSGQYNGDEDNDL
jgi:hypothetical protein